MIYLGHWTWKAEADMTLHEGTARAGSINSITLDANASLKIGAYKSQLVTITEGTGVGQARTIIEYNAATRVAEIRDTWATIPDNTSVFKIESAAWVAPEGCVGLLDLRSIPQMSIAGGTPEGYGVFDLSASAPNPGSSYRPLGDSLDATMQPALRSAIASQLGLRTTLESNRLNLLLYELFTMKADHTGETFARPLMPNMRRQMTMGLVGVNVHRERFNHEAIQHAATIRQIREQYRANRVAESEGRLPRDHHRRILDFMQKKLRIPWQNLVPPEFIGDPGPLQHRTIFTDDFNRSDEELGVGSWTEFVADFEVVSNEAHLVAGGASGRARHDNDLSGNDHYAQMDVIVYSPSRFAGTCVRYSASADTCYVGTCRNNNAATFRIIKIVTGTPSILRSVDGTAPAVTFETKIEIDGSDLELFEDTVSRATQTDTAIASGLRGGIEGTVHTSIAQRYDNFEAADLAVSGSISGVVPAVSSLFGTLAALGDLVGSVAAVTALVATLGATGALAATDGEFAPASTFSATLGAKGSLDGTSAGASTFSGTLSARGDLAGTSSPAGTFSSTLLATGDLAGSFPGATTFLGTLRPTGAIDGTISVLSSLSGTILATGDLSGTLPGVSTWAGTLSAKGDLAGTFAGLSTWTATVFGRLLAEGTTAATSTFVASLGAKGLLVGTLNPVSTFSATLDPLPGPIDGTIVDVIGVFSGTLRARGTLAGTLTAASSWSGSMVQESSDRRPYYQQRIDPSRWR